MRKMIVCLLLLCIAPSIALIAVVSVQAQTPVPPAQTWPGKVRQMIGTLHALPP
jgi:hypothetical protein